MQTYVRGNKRITAASVEGFQSAYLPLAAVAQEKRRSPRLLVKLIRKKRLPIIFVARANHASPQGFIARSRVPQLMAAIAESHFPHISEGICGNFPLGDLSGNATRAR